MKIMVLAGGLSPERNVSLTSGCQIANALIENGHQVTIFDLFLGKKNKEFKPIYHHKENKFRYHYMVSQAIPDLENLKKQNNYLISKDLIKYALKADLVFLALHGADGENGKIQALFDLYNIKYTGSTYEGSLLAMDKDIAKRLMKVNDILTPNWLNINLKQKYNLDNILYPCVVKPTSCGSSIGISIVNNKEELTWALTKAQEYEDNILIEPFIEGQEFTVAILDNKALPIIAIKPIKGFYDYENKYQQGKTIEECPAQINEKLAQKLKVIAYQVHQTLHLGKYSRIDFLVDKDENIYCLEANTLPGMTPTSLFPQASQAAGISFNELCQKIIEL